MLLPASDDPEGKRENKKGLLGLKQLKGLSQKKKKKQTKAVKVLLYFYNRRQISDFCLVSMQSPSWLVNFFFVSEMNRTGKTKRWRNKTRVVQTIPQVFRDHSHVESGVCLSEQVSAVCTHHQCPPHHPQACVPGFIQSDMWSHIRQRTGRAQLCRGLAWRRD